MRLVTSGQVTIAVDLTPVTDLLTTLLGKVNTLATQADVDALAAKLDALATDLAARTGDLNDAISGVAADIQALKDQHPALDLTSLAAKVDTLTAAGQAMDAAVRGAQDLDAANPPPG